MFRATTFCALFLVWSTPVAPAASQVAVAGEGVLGGGGIVSVVGPEVSGDRMVWGVGREGGVEFRSLGADGRVTVVGRPSGPGVWDLSLDEDRLAYSRIHSECSGDDCFSGIFLDSAEIAEGPVGGPYTPLDLCAGSETWCPGSSYCQPYLPVELAEGVLTHQAVCTYEAAVSRDLATGATMRHRGGKPGFFYWRAYGRYVAFLDEPADGESPSEVVVSDSVSGKELYRVEHPGPTFDVGDGGLLAVVNRANGELSWATPEEPFLHPLATVPPSSSFVSVRRGVIAVGTSFTRLMEFRLFDLAGHMKFGTAPLTGTDWDFDGRRLAWEEAPCYVAIVVAWDLRDEFPTTSPSRCPAATFDSARKRLSKDGRVRLRLACPAQPQLGCSGAVRLEARLRNREAVMLGTDNYRILPAATGRVEVTLERPARRFVRRHEPVRVRGTTFATRRSGHDSEERRRFRFRLTAPSSGE